MIKLQLINADIIDNTDTIMSRLFRKSFNCRYNLSMDYAFCLLTLKSSEKWRSPLFDATCNFNDRILPYGILFLTFINTNVFYLLSFKFSHLLVKTMAFSFNKKKSYRNVSFGDYIRICFCTRKKTLKNTEGAIKNRQSRETGNIEYTRRRQKSYGVWDIYVLAIKFCILVPHLVSTHNLSLP